MKTQYQVIKEVAKELGIEIKVAKKNDFYKVGIHKLYPDMNDLHDALDTAEKDMFKTIYIHNSNTWIK